MVYRHCGPSRDNDCAHSIAGRKASSQNSRILEVQNAKTRWMTAGSVRQRMAAMVLGRGAHLLALLVVCTFPRSSWAASLDPVTAQSPRTTPFKAPFAIIDTHGDCVSASSMLSYLQDSFPSDKLCRPVVALGCADNCDAINSLLNSSFPDSQNAVFAQASGRLVVINCNFDHMFGGKMCGARALDVAAVLKYPTVLYLQYDGKESFSLAHDQVLRRLLAPAAQAANASGPATRRHISVLLSGSWKDSEWETVLTGAQETIAGVWLELAGGTAMEAAALTVDVLGAREATDTMLALEDAPQLSAERVSAEFTSAYAGYSPSSLPQPKPIQSLLSRTSMMRVEAAYNAGMHAADSTLAALRSRIERGRAVPALGDRLGALVDNSASDFARATRRVSCVRERLDRAAILRDHIISHSRHLLDRQTTLLETRGMNDLRVALRKLHLAGEDASSLQQAAGRAAEAFASRLLDLKFDAQGAKLEDERARTASAFADRCRTVAQAFPDSPEGRLLALRRIEKEASRQPSGGRKGAGRALKIGITAALVGMLRPPGMGNLQGFLSAASGVRLPEALVSLVPGGLSLAVEGCLGVQNDGDSPEIVGDDREHPLLRLQPKFNFDVDF